MDFTAFNKEQDPSERSTIPCQGRKLTKTANIHETCEDCNLLIRGFSEDQFNTKLERFLYCVDFVKDQQWSNMKSMALPIIHRIHQSPTLENFSRAFDAVVEQVRSDSQQAGGVAYSQQLQILLMQYAEKAYLRFLYKHISSKTKLESQECFEIDLTNKTVRLGFSALGLSASTELLLVKELPAKPGIKICGDAALSKFSTLMNHLVQLEELDKTDSVVNFSKQVVLSLCLGELAKLKRISNQEYLVNHINIAKRYLSECQEYLDLLSSKYSLFDRPVPIEELVGQPGIGKSFSLRALVWLIKAIVPPVVIESDIVYSRANDYWWNGYRGQAIVLYDDFTHIRRLKFDLIGELIMIGSGRLQNIPMAFEKDMRFTSLLCVVTSNIPVVTKTHVKETLGALKRRIVSARYFPLNSYVATLTTDNFYKYNNNFGFLFSTIVDSNGRVPFSLFRSCADLGASSATDKEYDNSFIVNSLSTFFDKQTSTQTSSVPESHSEIDDYASRSLCPTTTDFMAEFSENLKPLNQGRRSSRNFRHEIYLLKCAGDYARDEFLE